MSEGLQRAGLTQSLRRISEGDRGALREVYQRTCAKLFGVCLRILNDHQEAEDVLTDVYLTVWRRAETFDPAKVSPISWMLSIARNHAIDRVRVSARTMLDIEETMAPASGGTPDAEHAEVHTRLEALDPKHAAALRTAYFEGLTYPALAGLADTSPEVVRTWIVRALASLRDGAEADAAAESALGVLDGEDRRAAAARMATDPAFAAEVAAWEDCLSPLVAEVRPFEPSAQVWARIVAGVGAAPGPWNSVVFWRGATVAGIAAAAAALAIAAGRFGSG
jgi:RNA polymerase sigma-70 factor (ECF subfamily)